jgi:hypothetical protein
MHIYYNFCNTELEEKRKRMSDLVLTFISFKNFYLPYSRVGAGAGAASKFMPGAGAA